MRIDELCPRDRAACLRAESRNRFDDFDTQAADRSVRLIGRLPGPTPLRADNGDPSTYLWAACFAPEDMPRAPVRTRWRRLAWRREYKPALPPRRITVAMAAAMGIDFSPGTDGFLRTSASSFAIEFEKVEAALAYFRDKK
jgi:hypothetical protein